MNEPLDELYLTWLYSQVGSVKQKNRSRTYWSLLRQLYKKEFVWFVPNDGNRVEDGECLRPLFLRSERIDDPDPRWMDLGCSVLEMLIALSDRLAFEDGGDRSDWFWHLLGNLGLLQYTDRHYDDECAEEINDVLERLLRRRYAPNGHGGLFPLQRADRDQRDVEIWYQASAYLIERYE